MKLSLVIPVFDDRKILLMSAQDLYAFWSRFPIETEILFVTDPKKGFSPAGLAEELQMLSQNSRVQFRVLANRRRLGRGGSLFRGLNEASGEVLAAATLDLSIPLGEVFTALQEFLMNRTESFLLLGNRLGAKKKRRLAKKGLRSFFEGVEHEKAKRLGVHDPTCPFWMIRKDDWHRLGLHKLRSWFYTPQVLQAARRMHMPIRELDVQCLDHPETNFRFWESLLG